MKRLNIENDWSNAPHKNVVLDDMKFPNGAAVGKVLTCTDAAGNMQLQAPGALETVNWDNVENKPQVVEGLTDTGDGSQFLANDGTYKEVGGGGLPSGANNRMVYYDNLWKTTARLEYEETPTGKNSLVLWGHSGPAVNHLSLYQLQTEAQFYWTANNGSQKFIARGEMAYVRLHLSYDASKSFDVWMGGTGYNGITYKSNNSSFQVVNSSSTDNVIFKVNTTSGVNGGNVEVGGTNCSVDLRIYKLAGNGSAPLEATSNGTIRRTTGFTGTKVVNGETWTFENGILKSVT